MNSLRRYRLLPAILLMPVLYLLGWLIALPIGLLFSRVSYNTVSLIGTIFTFTLFLFVIPVWIRHRWNQNNPWKVIGVSEKNFLNAFEKFTRGIIWSLALLCPILISILLGPWGQWVGTIKIDDIFNALLLCFGVGFVEELIFRGWLWGETSSLFGKRIGLLLQAIIFGLVHINLNTGFIYFVKLFVGLFLLAIFLSIRRIIDKGSIWGCVGLHGGLVGGWFALNSGLIVIEANPPFALFGIGEIDKNPLAGFIAIGILFILILSHRKALGIAFCPFTGALSASSNGAKP